MMWHEPKRRLPYMSESWFARLENEVRRSSMGRTAERLGLTVSAVSQVLNGTGGYGEGKCGTGKIAERVRVFLDIQITCPFLSAVTGEPKKIAGDECRDYAYREVPTGSPMATRHWRACRTCEKRVPPPRGWEEARAAFADPKFYRPLRKQPAVTLAVAAADNNPEEAR
jgi:hypothetical protein